MRVSLSFTLLSTLIYASNVQSLPNQVLFHATQAHESTLAADADNVQTIFSPSDSSNFKIRTRTQTVHQPRFPSDIMRIRERSLRLQQSEAIEWVQKEVIAPDVTDRETLQELAKMTGNAYAQPGHSNWYNISSRWNTVSFDTANRGKWTNMELLDRATTLGGNRMRMDSVDMCLCLMMRISWSWCVFFLAQSVRAVS